MQTLAAKNTFCHSQLSVYLCYYLKLNKDVMVDRIISWGFDEFVKTHCEIHALNVYLADQASFFPLCVYIYGIWETMYGLFAYVIKLTAGISESFKKR